MLKYTTCEVTFAEIPDEINLCINISNCPNNCKGCHSTYLKEDIGTELTTDILKTLIEQNKGISCVVFLGGDSDPAYINDLAFWIRINYPKLKIAWYSGKPYISSDIKLINFDYIKYGPYQEENGPLTSKTTNQKMIHIEHFSDTLSLNIITSKFWK
jgi:anaerobic ribonucleoside-triphosphate reductase activating protein